MNRIIVIGNGFDKAHGLKTGYRDFIDSYWTDFLEHINGSHWRHIAQRWGVLSSPNSYEDKFVRFEISYYDKRYNASEPPLQPQPYSSPYNEVLGFIAVLNDHRNTISEGSVRLTFKNKFFGHISNRSDLANWLDIENEYYGKLKELLTENDAEVRHKKVQELNRDFEAVKKQLEDYLTRIVDQAEIKAFSSIHKAFNSCIKADDVAYEKRKLTGNNVWTTKDHDPTHILILNFNYTATAERLYADRRCKVIHIHGELGNCRNPIIFGYGDELDDDYKSIEKLQDNDFMENIKSVRYHETDNYRRLLGFLYSDPYQVSIMGHSCGNSGPCPVRRHS